MRGLRALKSLLPINSFRSFADLPVYVGSSQSPPLIHSLPLVQPSGPPVYLVRLPSTRFLRQKRVFRSPTQPAAIRLRVFLREAFAQRDERRAPHVQQKPAPFPRRSSFRSSS